MIRYILGFIVVVCAAVYGYGYYKSYDSTPTDLVTASTLFQSSVLQDSSKGDGSAGNEVTEDVNEVANKVVNPSSTHKTSKTTLPAGDAGDAGGAGHVSSQDAQNGQGEHAKKSTKFSHPVTKGTNSAISVKSGGVSKPSDSGLVNGQAGAETRKDSGVVVRLKNVSLVVEDPSKELSDREKLIPVEPVELRAKPKAVAVVNMQPGSVRLKVESQLVSEGSPLLDVELAKTGASLPSLVPDKVSSQSQSQIASSASPASSATDSSQEVASDQKPLLVDASAIKRTTVAGMTYSPFSPPPPGTLPSTLVGAEPLNTHVDFGNPVGNNSSQGGSLGLAGAGGELDTLPPVSPQFSGVPVARATLPDPNQSPQGVWGGGSPQLPNQVQANPPPSQNPQASFFLSDSEAQAILDIAGSAGDPAGPANTLVGDTW
jgi:hypothetical protein